MQRLFLCVLLFASCVLEVAAQAPADIAKQTELSVRVVFSNGRSVGPNVRVEVLGAYGGSVTFGSTDTSGIVRFTRMDPAKYKLRVSGPGILTTESPDIDLSDAGPRVNYTLQVQPEGTMGESAPTATVDANVPKDARKEFEKGEDKMQSKNWADAQPHLEKAIAIYPKYAMAYNDLGVVLLALKQGEKAMENFRKAVELDPKLSQANLYLGQFYYENKQFKEAEPYLQRAADGDPRNPQILLALANTELKNGENEKALVNAQKVHATPDHKRFAVAHLIAAEVYTEKGDNQHAIDEYNIFLKEDPSSPMAPQVKGAVAKLATPAK